MYVYNEINCDKTRLKKHQQKNGLSLSASARTMELLGPLASELTEQAGESLTILSIRDVAGFKPGHSSGMLMREIEEYSGRVPHHWLDRGKTARNFHDLILRHKDHFPGVNKEGDERFSHITRMTSHLIDQKSAALEIMPTINNKHGIILLSPGNYTSSEFTYNLSRQLAFIDNDIPYAAQTENFWDRRGDGSTLTFYYNAKTAYEGSAYYAKKAHDLSLDPNYPQIWRTEQAIKSVMDTDDPMQTHDLLTPQSDRKYSNSDTVCCEGVHIFSDAFKVAAHENKYLPNRKRARLHLNASHRVATMIQVVAGEHDKHKHDDFAFGDGHYRTAQMGKRALRNGGLENAYASAIALQSSNIFAALTLEQKYLDHFIEASKTKIDDPQSETIQELTNQYTLAFHSLNARYHYDEKFRIIDKPENTGWSHWWQNTSNSFRQFGQNFGLNC